MAAAAAAYRHEGDGPLADAATPTKRLQEGSPRRGGRTRMGTTARSPQNLALHNRAGLAPGGWSDDCNKDRTRETAITKIRNTEKADHVTLEQDLDYCNVSGHRKKSKCRSQNKEAGQRYMGTLGRRWRGGCRVQTLRQARYASSSGVCGGGESREGGSNSSGAGSGESSDAMAAGGEGDGIRDGREGKMASGQGNKYDEERQERIRGNNEALQKVVAERKELPNSRGSHHGSGSSDESQKNQKVLNVVVKLRKRRKERSERGKANWAKMSELHTTGSCYERTLCSCLASHHKVTGYQQLVGTGMQLPYLYVFCSSYTPAPLARQAGCHNSGPRA
uniref:Uncharacterized protein n=1 Tax=Oryza barthii TaxID=65489 RepID=A0A0D3GMI6_9ORYZ